MNYDMYNFIRTATEGQLSNIALKMIAEHPDTFERLAAEFLPQVIRLEDPFSKRAFHFNQDQIRKLRAIPVERKIDRIKEVRAITGFGLKEAKDLVESEVFIKTVA